MSVVLQRRLLIKNMVIHQNSFPEKLTIDWSHGLGLEDTYGLRSLRIISKNVHVIVNQLSRRDFVFQSPG